MTTAVMDNGIYRFISRDLSFQ